MKKIVDVLLERVCSFPKLYISLFLLLLVGAVFGQTLRSGFINFDDQIYITENPAVKAGLDAHGVGWAFTHSVALNWHPLTVMSHMLDCSMYGLNAGGHHFTSLFLHGLGAVLLFLMLTELTGSVWRSGFVAAVFAVHPLRAESVAWISERKDVLSGVFFMLTVLAYLRYARKPFAVSRYLLVIVMLACGLMAKPMLVTVPFVLLLLDYWPLRRFDENATNEEKIKAAGRLFLEKIPLFALAALACMGTLLSQQEGIIHKSVLSLPLRLANTSLAYTSYVWEMFCPTRLALFYPHPQEDVSVAGSVIAWLMLAAVTVLCFLLRRKRPYLLVGWLWFLGMLVPVIGLVQVGQQAHADRYTYLPQIGLYILVTWLVAETCTGAAARKALGGMAVIIVAVLAVLGHQQTSYWFDSETLWRHTLAVTKNNYVALTNLGAALFQKGRTAEALAEFQEVLSLKPHDSDTYDSIGAIYVKDDRIAEAMDCFHKALEIYPEDNVAHKNLGLVLLKQNHLDGAITNFQLSLAEEPNDAEAHNAYANALLKKGDEAGAMTNYEMAVAIDPLNPGIQNNLGSVYLKRGALDKAMEHFGKVVEIDPEYPGALRTVALILSKAGKTDEAAQYYQQALTVDDKDAEAHFQLANILLAQGHAGDASVHYQKGLASSPHNAEAEGNLGLALVQSGDLAGAIDHWEKSLAIEPSNAKTHNNVAGALMALGRTQEAIAHYEKALAIQPQYIEAEKGLAWALATAPEASLRNGDKAVALATHVNESTHGNSALVLHILAATYAESNRFAEAVETAQRALALANDQHSAALAAAIQKELALYQANTPFHSPAMNHTN